MQSIFVPLYLKTIDPGSNFPDRIIFSGTVRTKVSGLNDDPISNLDLKEALTAALPENPIDLHPDG